MGPAARSQSAARWGCSSASETVVAAESDDRGRHGRDCRTQAMRRRTRWPVRAGRARSSRATGRRAKGSRPRDRLGVIQQSAVGDRPGRIDALVVGADDRFRGPAGFPDGDCFGDRPQLHEGRGASRRRASRRPSRGCVWSPERSTRHAATCRPGHQRTCGRASVFVRARVCCGRMRPPGRPRSRTRCRSPLH